MSSKLNSGVRYAEMRGGPSGECLRVKADMVLQVTLCDPYLSALEAFAKTRYTNRRYLIFTVVNCCAASSHSPRTGYACEGSTLTIRCAEDMRIRILRANYGRFSRAICNDGRDTEGWDIHCMSTRSLRIVSDL